MTPEEKREKEDRALRAWAEGRAALLVTQARWNALAPAIQALSVEAGMPLGGEVRIMDDAWFSEGVTMIVMGREVSEAEMKSMDTWKLPHR